MTLAVVHSPRALLLAAGLLCAAVALASAGEPEMQVSDASLPEARRAETWPLSARLENEGLVGDALIGVSAPQFAEARLTDINGVPLERLDIPPGQHRRLGPGGDALVLLGDPHDPVFEGWPIRLELTFERSGPVLVEMRAGARRSAGLQIVTAIGSARPRATEDDEAAAGAATEGPGGFPSEDALREMRDAPDR